MFCPNCGTQNEEAATPCKKCGLKLSGISAPKFKGTMMLSSDSSVQLLVEEHRRKLGEQAAVRAEAPASNLDPSLANSKPGLNTMRGGLQPVRPGVSRPRPGGTMIGVAPPIVGFAPAAPAVASAAALEATPDDLAPASGERRVEDTASAPAAAPPLNRAGSGPTLESAAPPRLAQDAGEQPPAIPDPTVDAQPAEAVAATPAEATCPAPQSTPAAIPARAAPARVRPIEVFLILVTFGLYGLVLLLRQRREP